MDDKPRRVKVNIENSDAPYLYKIKWGERTVVATMQRVWVIEDGKMTELPHPSEWANESIT